MELNKKSKEYKLYDRLLYSYKNDIVQDDDIILLFRSADGIILNWFFNRDIMEEYYVGDSENNLEYQNWILLYLVESKYNNLTEAIVLDTLLELEYRLMGSPKIKELREKLGLTLNKLAFELRMPARTLERIEKGLEMPPNYIMRRIYVKLVNEVEQKEFEDRINKLAEDNPNDDFMQLLIKDLFRDDNKD
jgi:DNA-binding helix-turn-helix protein